jgi:hypothetical protein
MQKHTRHHSRSRKPQASKRQRSIRREIQSVIITVAGEHYVPAPVEIIATGERIATPQERAVASAVTW